MLTQKQIKNLSQIVVTNIVGNNKENKMKQIYFKTGCKLFDMVIGGNKNVEGAPSGRFINIVSK